MEYVPTFDILIFGALVGTCQCLYLARSIVWALTVIPLVSRVTVAVVLPLDTIPRSVQATTMSDNGHGHNSSRYRTMSSCKVVLYAIARTWRMSAPRRALPQPTGADR